MRAGQILDQGRDWAFSCFAAAFAISINANFKLPSTSRRRVSSSGDRFPRVFSRSASSMSIISRAPSRSSTGCPVRGSAYPPRSMAAFCPSDRIKFSNAGDRFGASAAGAAAGIALDVDAVPALVPAPVARAVLPAPAAVVEAVTGTVSRSRSCCSATSFRNSPSGVNSLRSTTLKLSSCLDSDNGISPRHSITSNELGKAV